MLNRVIGNKNYEFADTLRVVYQLREVTGAQNLRDALQSIAHLDIDGQIQLLYISHKVAAKDKAPTQEEFTDILLDNLGMLAITDLVSELADHLMYSGMSPEKIDAKKAEVAEAMKTAGAASSVTDID